MHWRHGGRRFSSGRQTQTKWALFVGVFYFNDGPMGTYLCFAANAAASPQAAVETKMDKYDMLDKVTEQFLGLFCVKGLCCHDYFVSHGVLVARFGCGRGVDGVYEV
jgi:hypothetical protein